MLALPSAGRASVPVPLDLFIPALRTRWQALGNVSSPALEAVWAQLGTVFNAQIQNHGTEEASRWNVVAAPTGTAKTVGLYVFAGLLSKTHGDFDHPGMLAITRMKTEADELAQNINEQAGRPVAVAFHSDSDLTLASLSGSPCVVLTHSAFQRALDTIDKDIPTAKSWQTFMRWNGGHRKLIAIDEAISLVEEATVDANDIRRLEGFITFEMSQQFPREVEAIKAVREKLEAVATEKANGKAVESIISDGVERLFGQVDLTLFRRSMLSSCRYDAVMQTRDADENRRLAGIYDGVLRQIQLLVNHWLLYSRIPMRGHTLSSARLLVPDDCQGAVVLDATARCSPVYELLDLAKVWPRVDGARNYANVNLHVSTGHSVGKNAILEDPAKHAGQFIGALAEPLNGRTTLVICHKAVESYVVPLESSFAMQVGHWGAVTGRNDWQYCDSVAILGLPYRPDLLSALEFMAMKGVQTDEWLSSRGNRPFGKHKDIRHAMRIGGIGSELVQAINRTRCRRVIDESGNCAPCDVYIALPGGIVGEEILAIVKEEMPGIQVLPWKYDGVKRKAKRSGHEAGLIKFIEHMGHGKVSAGEIRRKQHIPASSYKDMLRKLAEPRSRLSLAMKSHGVQYVTGGGRGSRSHFVKS